MKKFIFLATVLGLVLVFPKVSDAGCRSYCGSGYSGCGSSYYYGGCGTGYSYCQPQYYYPQVQRHHVAPQGGCPNGQCSPQTVVVQKPIPIAQPNQEQEKATSVKPEMAPCPAPLFVEF